jgi:hypothetical protein
MKRLFFIFFVTVISGYFGYSFGDQSSNVYIQYKSSPEDSYSLGKINGKLIKETDLQKEVISRLHQVRLQEYEIRFKHFKAILFETFVEKEANDKKLSKSDYMKKVLSEAKEPSKSDIQEFAKKYNLDIIKDKSIENRIKSKLKEDFIEDEKEKIIENLLSRNDVEVHFSKPRLAFSYESDTSPSIGDKGSKNKIIVFRDLKTSEGKKLSAIAECLVSKDSVVIFKDYSQVQGQDSDYPVQAQLCVFEKLGIEKYRSFSGKLANFKDKKEVDSYIFEMKDVLNCVKSNKNQLNARSNLIQALGLGLSGQSAIIINGAVLRAEETDQIKKFLLN